MLTAFMLGFGAGIAATPHCLGMCGGFPLALAKSESKRTSALRQVLFVAGKCFTYVFLGALAAALGLVLLRDTPLAKAGPWLRIAAGAIGLAFGLAMLGVRLPGKHGSTEGRKHGTEREVSSLLFPIPCSLFPGLTSPGLATAFVLGLGVGFLPCPLPMGMLALAAVSHSVGHGVALMAGVGLGTAPGLLAVGLFGMGLNIRLRKVGMRLAGLVVVLIGLLTICRAAGVMPRSHVVNAVVPPCCCEREGGSY